jgi:hypothetical protein
MKTREETLVEQINWAKQNQFGLTGIKIEFEANFKRREVITRHCDYCNGTALMTCGDCEGYDPGEYDCDSCDNRQTLDCDYCDGTVTRQEGDPDWNDMSFIHDQVLAKLVKYGLARKTPKDLTNALRNSRKYMPIAPLVYSKVYYDSSVDTEQTLTLLMDKPKNVLLFPKISDAFYALKDEIGKGIDVSNAGMHITLLNSPGAEYPTYSSETTRFTNFRKSMILLMPALFFLGSSSAKCRPMQFRKPKVARDDKYSAVAYRNGGLEFRVFETCFDTPEVILDDISVAINCLRFWTKRYTRNHLAKIANRVHFGKDGSDELTRLFVTTEHIELLNRGLRMIKPSYLSITELKKQRGFSLTKTDTKTADIRAREQAEKEYKTYEKRFSWEMVMRRNNYINDYINGNILNYTSVNRPVDTPDIDDKVIKEAGDWADERLKNYEIDAKTPIDEYCKDAITHILNPGSYELCVE